MDKIARIAAFITDHDWLTGPLRCVFLAAGEYNENYLVENRGRRYVFRINHGTQLGLVDQISYEFEVLQAVKDSGVTPLAYHCVPQAEGLGNGVMLMEYIEGRPLDYRRDLGVAADIFARIHGLPSSASLLGQPNPIAAICRESRGLLDRYPPAHYPEVEKLLRKQHDRLSRLAKDDILYPDEPLCIVNTEVNSGNFIINPTRPCLVDWEKAVVSCRYQDLAHFLLVTTTLWKTDVRLSPDEKRHFLDLYRHKATLDIPLNQLVARTSLLEEVILLRALSWCYMAYHEYTKLNRPLSNDYTFAKITSYLNEASCFFG
jgi:aminoglycoside phosphotransferase (APT) family kinase protein